MRSATASACSNIAFIKYWGNKDDALRLPLNASLSMNLAELQTETQVVWKDDLKSDTLILNGQPANDYALTRVQKHLDHIRARFSIKMFADVESHNNFPMGAGIASSASAFAALTVAAVAAADEECSEQELSTLARLGSGSASRSIPSGFVEWHDGDSHDASYAESFAPPTHWELVDLIAVISTDHKKTSSKEGHPTAATSDLNDARIAGAAGSFCDCETSHTRIVTLRRLQPLLSMTVT